MSKQKRKCIEMKITKDLIDVEDGGCAKIIHCDGDGPEQDTGMFVRLHSWSDKKVHSELDAFIGRKVRITVETID